MGSYLDIKHNEKEDDCFCINCIIKNESKRMRKIPSEGLKKSGIVGFYIEVPRKIDFREKMIKK